MSEEIVNSGGSVTVTESVKKITLFLLFIGYAFAQSPKVVPGEYIVKYKVDIGSGRVISKISSKVNLKAAFPEMNMLHFSVKPGQEASLTELKNDPDVLFVEPNYILEKLEDGNPGQIVDRLSVDQVYSMSSGTFSQNYASVRVDQAWSTSSAYNSNNRPIVAIIDTGLDKSHTVFQNTDALWVNAREIPSNGVDDDQNGYVDDVNGWNFIANSPNFMDDEGHGTHVGGIVLGAGLDIFSPQLDKAKIRIMPLKFLDSKGAGATSDAIKAIYYATNNGARIINNSWGGPGFSSALLEALTYAYNNKVLIVSAAGNSAKNNDTNEMYPANYNVPSNISIAATTDTDRLASFSNYGPGLVHVASPGVYIYSTLIGNQFGSMSGTSMAAPFVSGIAAMALREANSLTGYQLKNMIISTATYLGNLSGRVSSSSRVDAYTLILQAKSNFSTQAAQPDYKPEYEQERTPASEPQESSKSKGGCGMISTAFMNNSGNGLGGYSVGESLFLSILFSLPFAFYIFLRTRKPVYKRKYDRFVMNSNIRVKLGDRELVAQLNTISVGGLSFNADEMIDKGGSVVMKIKGPDGKEVEVEGHVVWSSATQAHGVQFSEVKQSIASTIMNWTSALVKAN